MQARMDSRPDAETLAWIDSRFDQVVDGYRGLTHACNLVLARIEDRDAKEKAQEKRIESLEEKLHEVQVLIGKLQAEFTKSIHKQRVAYSELKKQVDSSV